jgi:hypothetical protein
MPILYGTVAYNEDHLQDFEREIHSWDLAKHADAIGCPAGCSVQYDLYAEINASEDQVHEYIDLIHKHLQRDCFRHNERIRINPKG